MAGLFVSTMFFSVMPFMGGMQGLSRFKWLFSQLCARSRQTLSVGAQCTQLSLVRTYFKSRMIEIMTGPTGGP